MGITRRCVVLCCLAVVLTACGDDAEPVDYKAMTPDEVCELVTVDEARELMKGITDEPVAAKNDTKPGVSGDLPACRYESGEGNPYLQVSIYQSSGVGGDKITVAGQDARRQRPDDHSCSVSIPLEERLSLLAIVESWDPREESCTPASQALEKAFPRLSA